MSENVSVQTVETGTPFFRRVSWGAIFAGFFVTLVIQIMLTLLGAALGLASIDSLRDSQPGQRVALGAAIWLLASGLLSIWVGSCVAGRLAGGPLRSDGLVHGVVTWSLSTCVTLALLATAAGALFGGTGALLNGALALRSSTVAQNETASLSDQVKALFQQPAPTLPPTGRVEGNTQNPAEPDKQAAQPQNQTGQQSAQKFAQAPLWAFLALFLGLLVAAWGGWTGTASVPGYVETATVTTAKAR